MPTERWLQGYFCNRLVINPFFISTPYHRRIFALPTPYLRRFMFGFR